MMPIFKLMYRDMKMATNKSNLGIQLVSPVMYIFVIGFMYNSIISSVEIEGEEFSYVLFLTPGIIVMQIMFAAMSSGVLFWIDRRYAMFEQILSSPFTRTEYILSKILSSTFQGILSGFLVIIMASPILVREGITITIVGVLYIIGAFFFGAFFFGALTLMISVFSRSNEAFNLVIGVIFMPFLALSSVFYPLDNAPIVLRMISYVNPLTYVADMTRAGLLGISTSALPYEITLLMIESLAMFYIANIGYNKIVKI